MITKIFLSLTLGLLGLAGLGVALGAAAPGGVIFGLIALIAAVGVALGA